MSRNLLDKLNSGNMFHLSLFFLYFIGLTPPFTFRAENPKKVEKTKSIVIQNPFKKLRRNPGRLYKGLLYDLIMII